MSTKPEDVTFEAVDGLKKAKRTVMRLKTAFRSLGMDNFRFRLIERTEYDMYKPRYGVLVSQQRKTDAKRLAQPEYVDISNESGVLLLQIVVNYYDSKDQILDAIALANSDMEKGTKVEDGFRLLDGFSGTTGKETDSDWDHMSDDSATEGTDDFNSADGDGEWSLL